MVFCCFVSFKFHVYFSPRIFSSPRLKILESSQLLLNMVKREAADLVETLQSTERTETA